MKSQQINFYMMPEDVAELEQYIKEQGLLIIASRMPQPHPLLLENLINSNMLKTYIITSENLNTIPFQYYDSFGSYIVSELNAPVIEFSKSVYIPEKNKMNKGRLYFDKYYLTKDNKEELKDEQTIRCADNIFKWFKKHFKNTKTNSNFTTPRTNDWATQNNILLAIN